MTFGETDTDPAGSAAQAPLATRLRGPGVCTAPCPAPQMAPQPSCTETTGSLGSGMLSTRIAPKSSKITFFPTAVDMLWHSSRRAQFRKVIGGETPPLTLCSNSCQPNLEGGKAPCTLFQLKISEKWGFLYQFSLARQNQVLCCCEIHRCRSWKGEAGAAVPLLSLVPILCHGEFCQLLWKNAASH